MKQHLQTQGAAAVASAPEEYECVRFALLLHTATSASRDHASSARLRGICSTACQLLAQHLADFFQQEPKLTCVPATSASPGTRRHVSSQQLGSLSR